jgi:hypothetical protein
MSTTAASGSGEPPAGRDYGGDKALPRSGLLEPAREPDRPTASLLGTLLASLVGGRLRALFGVRKVAAVYFSLSIPVVEANCETHRSISEGP